MNTKVSKKTALYRFSDMAVRFLLAGAILLVLAACSGQRSNKILMVVADKDFYDPEYVIPRESLETAGYVVEVASIDGGQAIGLNGLEVELDWAVKEAEAEDYLSLLLVGGYGAVQYYGNQDLIELIQDFDAQEKIIGGQCYSPVVIGEAGLLDGVKATCWNTQGDLLSDTGAEYTGNLVEVSGRIVTGVSGPDPNVRAFTEAYMAELERQPEKGSESASASGKNQEQELADTPFTLSADQKSFTLVHAGIKRSGSIFIPEAPDTERPRSLLIGLHGMNSLPTSFQQVGFDDYAAKNNFVNIYPAATYGVWEVEFGIDYNDDDAGFIRRVIEDAIEEFDIDPERVYLTGHSNGGFMTYKLATELSDILAAAAPVSGAIVAPNLNLRDVETQPIPLMHLHGADDPVVPISGIQGYTKSVPDSIEFWKAINGANELASSKTTSTWGGLEAEVEVWEGSGTMVKSIVYSGGGHAWPLTATDEIMGFFTQNPPTENSIDFSGTVLPMIVEPGERVTIQPDLSQLDTTELSRIELLNGNEVLAEALAAPWELEFTVMDYSKYDLELRAVFSDGTSITSGRIQSLASVGTKIPRSTNVIASSNENEELPSIHTVDGDLTTRWASEFNDNQELRVDLGSVKEINGVTIIWEAASAKSYTIEVSDDGENWNTVKSISQSSGGIEQSNFETVSGRYIKLDLGVRATEWGFSIWEIFAH